MSLLIITVLMFIIIKAFIIEAITTSVKEAVAIVFVILLKNLLSD